MRWDNKPNLPAQRTVTVSDFSLNVFPLFLSDQIVFDVPEGGTMQSLEYRGSTVMIFCLRTLMISLNKTEL